MPTQEAYKEALYSTFKSKVDVEDIYVIPDYSTILSECGDPNLSCYAKGENTQLQFTFTAVDISSDYPTGVKVNYRAYSSDKIYEIVKGAEPHPVHKQSIYPVQRQVEVFPCADLERNIPAGKRLHLRQFLLQIVILGTNILKRLPNISKQELYRRRLFQKFPVGSRKAFDDCLASIVKHYQKHSPHVVTQWKEWEKTTIPANDDVIDHIRR